MVRQLYGAWPAGDRATVERLLAEDFRFTSPYDNAIDRTTFFERCWPGHRAMKQLILRRIVVDGDDAYVTYHLEFKDGRHVENTELLRFAGAKLVAADVYFGPEHDANGNVVAMKRAT